MKNVWQPMITRTDIENDKTDNNIENDNVVIDIENDNTDNNIDIENH